MNNIFQKNISALMVKNQELAQKLLKYIPLEVPMLVQENGCFNLQYKGKFIHNKTNPLAEAQEIFSLAENIPVAIHLVYGLGLGYLFQVASLNSKGTVILYEPDLNLLWLSFTLVDFSADILKENVYICETFEEVSEAIYLKSGMKNIPQLLSIPTQREFDKKGFDELVFNLKNLIGSYSLDLKYTKQRFYPNLLSLLKNIPFLQEEEPLAHYKDIYKGKTAVVVSAGPTLDRNIETLKANRDKYILFVVGTAAKTLYQHGLKPDFIVIIETYNSKRQLEGLDLKDVNFITEPYSHTELRNFNFKRRFSHISANTPVNLFWGDLIGESVEEYWSKGTVSYTALNCARLLGCSKIVLVGQDLAYIEGQCYSKDSAYKDLVCGINPENNLWEIMAKDMDKFANAISVSEDPEKRLAVAKQRLKNLNASLHVVKGINGEMIPTESVYAAFVQPLQEYVKHFDDRKYINTSLVGAQIDGFENLSLEEALKDSAPVGDIELNSQYIFEKQRLFDNLNVKINELEQALIIIEDGKQVLKSLNNEIKRHKDINAEVLKILKKLSLIYLSLSSEFTEKSEMFDFITIAKRIDLDYEMKMTQNFTMDAVLNISQKMFDYFETAKVGIEKVSNIVREVVNESFNTEG